MNIATIRNVCRILNTQFGWKPGEAECLCLDEICEYYWIFIQKLVFDNTGDWQKFEDQCVNTRDVIVKRTSGMIHTLFKKNEKLKEQV